MWSTDMTPEQIKEATEFQRRHDLWQAKLWRDHYQKEVDRLEALDPLRHVSTGTE